MNVQKIASLRSIGRRRFMQMCAGSLALAAAGCRRGGDPAYRRGSTLVMAVSDVNDIKPDATDLDFLVFLPLATRDEKGEFEPRLAQSWEHSPDYREWTYHLRTDVKWQDGVPVTAHDVKFTLDLLGHPDVHEYIFDSVTIVDDATVKIRGLPGYQDDIVYFPKHLLEHLDPKTFWEWEFWTRPVGNGPYRFVRYVPETMIEFEANPDYYRGKPKVERVILKFVGKAGLTELLSGNVDIVLGGDPSQIPRVANDPRFRVYHSFVAGALAIYWKCDHPLFRDVRVRRALTLALDRRELLRLLNLPDDLPITDGVFTDRQFRRRELLEPLPYDPPQARAVLEAAGWRGLDGDGVRERDGRKFRFTAITSNTRGFDRLAVYVQAMLRRVGVQMDIQMMDGSLMWGRVGAGDFEAAFHIRQPYPGAQKRDFGRNNPTGYRNHKAFGLLDEVVATSDPNEVDRIYRALTEIFRADLPFTRLVTGTDTTFVHRRVRGLSTPFHANPDTYMEDLWLEDGSQQ